MIIVRENTVRFVERFGKLERILKPGLNFFFPVIERVTREISLKEQISTLEHQKVITKDNVEIDVDGNFFYKVNDPNKAFYNAFDFVSAIEGLSTSVSRAEIGKMTLDQIFQNRKELNDLIKENINESTANWGLECLSYEILRIDPPAKIKEALREVAVAERLRRKEITISEAEREFKEKVSQAERDAQIIVGRAKAEGQQIISQKLGQAFAEMNRVLQGTENRKEILDFVVMEAYLERLKEIIKANKVFMMPQGQLSGGESLLMVAKAFGFAENKEKENEGLMASLKAEVKKELEKLESEKKESQQKKTEEEALNEKEEILKQRILAAQTKATNAVNS